MISLIFKVLWYFFFLFLLMGIEPKASHMLNTYSITKLYPQLLKFYDSYNKYLPTEIASKEYYQEFNPHHILLTFYIVPWLFLSFPFLVNTFYSWIALIFSHRWNLSHEIDFPHLIFWWMPPALWGQDSMG